MGQIIAQKMSEEAAEGGASAIAGCGRVRSVGLDVIEEAGDRIGVQIAESQRCNIPTIATCNKLEEELQHVSVGTHGMHASAALAR
jgi:hypothetical protein